MQCSISLYKLDDIGLLSLVAICSIVSHACPNDSVHAYKQIVQTYSEFLIELLTNWQYVVQFEVIMKNLLKL